MHAVHALQCAPALARGRALKHVVPPPMVDLNSRCTRYFLQALHEKSAKKARQEKGCVERITRGGLILFYECLRILPAFDI